MTVARYKATVLSGMQGRYSVRYSLQMSLLHYYERTAPIPYRHGYLSTRISSPSLSRSYDSLPLSHVNLFTLVTHWYGGYTHLLPLLPFLQGTVTSVELITDTLVHDSTFRRGEDSSAILRSLEFSRVVSMHRGQDNWIQTRPGPLNRESRCCILRGIALLHGK
jgi:hypothetical protein